MRSPFSSLRATLTGSEPDPAAGRRGSSERGLFAEVAELRGLVTTYVKQEAVPQFGRLAHQLKWGLAGAALFGLSGIFLSVALLRVLQTETPDWFMRGGGFAPYIITVTVIVFALLISAARIIRGHDEVSSPSDQLEVGGPNGRP